MTKKISFLTIMTCTGLFTGLFANPPYGPGGMDGHHKRFVQLDTNKDGKISQEEWMAHFKAIDTDKDGNLSESEMDKHHQTMMEQKHEEMHKKMHENMKK